MARVHQATSRVLDNPPPFSYDGKPISLMFREIDIPNTALKNADGTVLKSRHGVGDVVEIIRLPKKHAVLQLWADTTANPSCTINFGILKGTIGEEHEGTGEDDVNRSLSSGESAWTDGVEKAIHDEDKDMVFDVDQENDRAIGYYVSVASTANETFKLKCAVVYANLEYID